MSYRHGLLQSPTFDYSNTTKRQPSIASNSSSAYSNASSAFGLSRTSTLSSAASSGYNTYSHKRGSSDATIMPSYTARDRPTTRGGSVESSPDYKSVRQSLRPLPQPPVYKQPPTPERPKSQHFRSQSEDISEECQENHYSANLSIRTKSVRPQSMILTRSDSISRGAPSVRAPPPRSALSPTTFVAPDIQSLEKSSTGHLRTLSRFAQTTTVEEFTVTSPTQEVTGLHGRRRLQRSDTGSARPGTVAMRTEYGWGGRNWMDKQRQFLQAYEYLCHIGEAKEWIERVIDKNIPVIVQLEEALRDGVTLAEIVQALQPDRHFKIFRHSKLQYRHSDNIAVFFRFLNEVELPELFRFELIDLYEKKNIPKVIYCIHALSWLLYRQGVVEFRIGNLVGQLEFEHHELEATQKGLDKAGIAMPSFGNMGAAFNVEPEPEPVESEEDRIDRELQENEHMIVDLQAQIRGAAVRMQLGNTMQRLWDSEELLIELQSKIRGDFAREISNYRLSMRRFATNLQASARGFLVRRQQQKRESYWKSREVDVLRLQNLIRARKVRCEVQGLKMELRHEGAAVRQVQAALRGYLARSRIDAQYAETKRKSASLIPLQAAIRGMLERKSIQQQQYALERQTRSIMKLQGLSRAMLVRKQASETATALRAASPIWRALQTVARGKQLRKSIAATKVDLKKHTAGIASLQSAVRAAAVRRQTASTRSMLAAQQASIQDLQGQIRGMLHRQKLADEYEAILANEKVIKKLQGYAQGYISRQRNGRLIGELKTHTSDIGQVQAFMRAMLLRNEIGTLLAELEDYEEQIVEFQALARASMVRIKFAEKKKFFKENMQKVIKIQSFVRAKIQGEAYKNLTTGKNPPVNTVKNFVHLLNDSDFDFNEEIEFERLRKTVVQQVRQNELAEQYIDQLDIKIALLVKNKITLDDVMQHQKNYGGHAGLLLSNTSISSGNGFDLKALNKNSRKKLESYQQLFFTLQTQPQYLARLFKRIREEGTAEQECKRIETLMMGLFGYAQKRREEYYLLKLISRSIKEEVDGCHSLQDYVRGNFFWGKLLANYTRSPRDRKFLRDLFGPLIRTHIVEDPALDLESDPLQIYRSAISNEELRTGQPSHRPLDIPREVAIKDKETRALFIDHLRDLREISDQVLLAMEDLLHKMPYGFRYISQQIYRQLAERFPREDHHHLLQTVGSWVWRFYLQPALTNPEQIGVIEKILSPLQKRNLNEVNKVLSQVSQGKLFGGDNIYLQPLNAYVGGAIERLGHIISNLINVPDVESTFDIDEFNDLYAKTKPTLYIKANDVFAIHKLIADEIAQICPHRDDVLREIMHELGNVKNNESEMLGVGSGDIHMTLNPKLHQLEDPEAEVKALFMETKRCVLYIIRVQSGPNLLEILVRPITREDDDKWRALLREEFGPGSSTRGAYSDANMIVDITQLTYAELKRTALENIMKLERAGRISRHNYYQDILNAIALDIRTKSRRRVQRQRELEGVRLTLANLHEKAKYLEQQRKSYDNYIEQAMMTLQNKKGKKRFLLPFTKQYNHERELERSGRRPKFGSYKYSARRLLDKGVLVSFPPYTSGQGHSASGLDKLNITISCDEVGVFVIEGSMGSTMIPGASATVPLEECLAAQFENRQWLGVFGAKGQGQGQGGEEGARLNVNLLLHLIYRKFYSAGE